MPNRLSKTVSSRLPKVLLQAWLPAASLVRRVTIAVFPAVPSKLDGMDVIKKNSLRKNRYVLFKMQRVQYICAHLLTALWKFVGAGIC